MKVKDDTVYIEHMLKCVQRIDEYVESKEQFYAAHIVQDAVVRNLQIMAESSKRISNEAKLKFPDIPWKQISGFRNILVHDYLGIDLDVIWSVIEQELSNIKKILIKM